MAKMGRPRTFDREAALQQAMHLFWEHGYDSTSLAMLKANIGGGISAPSFYAAFGSKEELFREVVQHYIKSHGHVADSLWDDQLAPRQAMETALRRSAQMQTECDHPAGCLMVISASACSPEHAQIQQLLAEQRALTRQAFEHCVQRAVDLGDLPSSINVSAFASLFVSFLMGLSIQTRDGVAIDVLETAISQIMLSWDSVAASAVATRTAPASADSGKVKTSSKAAIA
ncbi:TetR/AcrR family transcriptional regulator [Pseudomonas sp. 5P_3.1_Bac2]|uniref:TetR/AcrR family transcriptional regulator n=1 Tax=Pseudomonas sp. 5P_3.1_Bac2 TaxID=2971617 RepID=UPI0021C8D5BE|nr:TetR/AcrR family transcriptional regulator [Pseudomonas sp. 5P_3.1_Bac2]MCU1717002.1 TetR/AcrR family transcriptional regulator [Pseudomonas sp. 5P_3.1_Bac2]